MNKGSHGMGLSICKRIANNLGGDLTHNDKSRGSCEFVLSLTLKKSTKDLSHMKFKKYFGNKKKLLAGSNHHLLSLGQVFETE